MIEREHKTMSVIRQCKLLGLSRSGLYYQSHCDATRKIFEHELLHAIDALYTAQPTLGRYGMTDALAEQYNIEVNPKRVRRLMKKLGLQAVYPKPRKNTSLSNPDHLKYPYLLRNMPITEPDQVWCADITYIRLHQGFAYLVAVMDWFSRCVLSWELSNTLDASFCVEALERTLTLPGARDRRPTIFNTDQGSQFTSQGFTDVLKTHGIAISMDGVGRAFDNIMVERLWRTVKYEDVYIRDYQTPAEARLGLNRYFTYYNHRRRHRSLNRQTPAKVYGLTTPLRMDTPILASATALDGPSIDGMIKTGNGWSVATQVAVAPLALRAPGATATPNPPEPMTP